jgi:hypothetical protein
MYRGTRWLICRKTFIITANIATIRVIEMRRLAIGILVLALLSGHALAHTPAGVEVSYDERAGDLGVAITHQVDDPTMHYVKQVTVRQGTTVLVSQSYTSQPDKSAFTYRYNLLQLKEKSGEITVDVECNVFGTRSGTLMLVGPTVAKVPSGTTPAPTQAPGCVLIALLALALVTTRIMR